jgi:hypothetical protein
LQAEALATCKVCHSSRVSGANRKEVPFQIEFDPV